MSSLTPGVQKKIRDSYKNIATKTIHVDWQGFQTTKKIQTTILVFAPVKKQSGVGKEKQKFKSELLGPNLFLLHKSQKFEHMPMSHV